MIRRVLGWGKPLGYDVRSVSTPFHAIVAIVGGAFVTACWGRWMAINTWRRGPHFDPKLDVGDYDERWIYYPTPFLRPGETYEVNHLSRFPRGAHMDEPCGACLFELGCPRTVELKGARREGIELLKHSEVY